MYEKVFNTKSLLRTNPLGPPEAGTVQIDIEYLTEAIVVDVIVDETHNNYTKDGYNVGCIQFAIPSIHSNRTDAKLNWAYPIDSNIIGFPLKNEMVLVSRYLNRFYYTKKINVGNGPSHQAMFGLKNALIRQQSNGNRLNTEQTKSAPNNMSNIEDSLGKYFKINKDVYRLKHWEGDLIIEGRSGHSIRFGASWKDQRIHGGFFKATESDQSPLLIFSVGHNPSAVKTVDNYAGRIVEDINKDKTSLWMVSDVVVPLEPATKDFPYHSRSIRDYPTIFDKNQLIINTDRFIVNTKSDKILFYSGKGVHVTTLQDNTMDIERDFVGTVGRHYEFEIIGGYYQNIANESVSWIGLDNTVNIKGSSKYNVGQVFDISANKRVTLIAPKIFIGSESNSSEPMVLGQTLTDLLISLIDAHLTNSSQHVTTPTGGPGTLNPAIVTKLTALKNQLVGKKILSNDNFVNKENIEAKIIPDRVPIHSRPGRG